MALSVQSRPEPMNSSPHHSKVKVSLTLPQPIYVAGRDIAGKMEVECRADKGLGISIIVVELFAYQELTSRDHSATSTFLHSRRLFQGPSLPPSNAVHPHPQPSDPPLPQDYYQARRGISTFLFRIPLPSSSPSSISFASSLARVRYELRATVGVLWKGEKRLVVCKKEIEVVESYELDYARIEPEGVVVGEFGKIWVQGKVVVVGGGVRGVVAGESACVELHVKNHSSKKNNGLTVTLSRSLILPSLNPSSESPSPLIHLSDILTTVPFRGPEYIIQPGVEGIASLVFDVPPHARGVKGGTLQGDESEARTSESLFEIRCVVGVTINMGIGTKDIQLNIPVQVVHPAALPDEEEEEEQPVEYSHPRHREPPTASTPFPYHHHHHPHHPSAPLSPPPPPPPNTTAYIDPPLHHNHNHNHNQIYLPPQSSTPQPPNIYTSPPIGGGENYYYFPPPPHVPILTTAYLPARPSSAGAGAGASAAAQTDVISSYPHDVANLDLEPEAGKGERAARVTQHLRLTSRHRSVSPQSHRFPLPGVGGGGGSDNASYAYPGSVTELPLPQPQPRQRQPQTGGGYVSMRNLPPPPPGAGAGAGGLAVSSSLPFPTSAETKNKDVNAAAVVVVHSPRPVLSPRQSFSGSGSNGGIGGNSVPKSERVEQLERMADEVVKTMTGDLPSTKTEHPESNIDINKTLPVPPPFPTRKTQKNKDAEGGVIGKINHVNKIFFPSSKASPEEDNDDDETQAQVTTPRTPLAAVTPVRLPFKPSSKSSSSHVQLQLPNPNPNPNLSPNGHGNTNTSGIPNGGLESDNNGLDALERRLLAEVGTRKLLDLGSARRPVWDIVGGGSVGGGAQPIDIPSKKGNGGAGGGGRDGGDVPPDPLNDSAISSLTLAGEREATGGAAAGEADGEANVVGLSSLLEVDGDHDSDEKTHRAGKSSGSGGSKGDRGERGRRKAKKSEGKTSSGGGGSSSRTKKKSAAAKDRVAAWLGGIEVEVPPPVEDVLPIPPSSVVLRKMPSVSGYVDSPSKAGRVEKETSTKLEDEPAVVKEQDVPATPNPRSSGFVPIDTFKASRHLKPFDGKATVVKEARRAEEIWSSPPEAAKDIPPPPKDTSPLLPLITPARPIQSIRTDRNVSPPSMAGAVDLLGAKYHNPNALKKVPVNNIYSSKPVVVSKQAAINDRSPLRLPVLSSHIDSEVKYDVRSARGGRGGKVTAITAIWAAAGGPGADVASTKGNGKLVPETMQPNAKGAKSSPLDPVSLDTEHIPRTALAKSSLASSSSDVNTTAVPAALLSSGSKPTKPAERAPAPRRTPLVKSPSSVPAILSSSHATPTLSSTASLARPPTNQIRHAPAKVSPAVMIEASSAELKTRNNVKLADTTKPVSTTTTTTATNHHQGGGQFGQARLRDLIKKYQGQAT